MNFINKYLKKIYWIFLVVFAGLLFNLYYALVMKSGSDISTHIERGLQGGGYSLNSVIIRTLGLISQGKIIYVIYNTSMVIFTFFIIVWAIKTVLKEEGITVNRLIVYAFALSLFFVSSLYIPYINEVFYRNSANPNLSTVVTQPWHSDTYNLMRFFAVVVYVAYLKIEKNYKESIKLQEALLFVLILFLCNYAKPSFLVCFAPMMLLYLLKDFITTKGKTVIQQFKFGCLVLFTMPILFVQSEKLFGESTGNGVEFTLKRIQGAEITDWIIVFGCGLLAPVVITVVLMVKKCLDQTIVKAWIMYIIASVTSIFLAETGDRAPVNNFKWGQFICAYILYFSTVIYAWIAYSKKKITKKEFICLLAFYMLHIICGLINFGLVLQTKDYSH